MKFSAAIVLIVVGLVFADESTNSEDKNSIEKRRIEMTKTIMDWQMKNGPRYSQCIWRPEEKTFSCRLGAETIECSAVSDFSLLGSRSWNLWGIGWVPEVANGKVETRRFWLYPRNFDNTTYLNHSFIENGKSVDLSIWFGEKQSTTWNGWRVTDLKCWERMVKIWDWSSRQMVRLETEPTVITEVPLIGEILVWDKTAQNRWLWGYGWSPSSWGWNTNTWGWNPLPWGWVPYSWNWSA